MSEYLRYDFLPTGIRNSGAYLLLKEQPQLTINLHHTITSLKSRYVADQYSTTDVLLSGFINDINKQALFRATYSTNVVSNFDLQNPVDTLTTLFSGTRRIRAIYFNEHYFLHEPFPNTEPQLIRLSANNTTVIDPYTYPAGFDPLTAVNTYANRLYISDMIEPVVVYSGINQIQGATTLFDLKNIGSNAPVAYIEDISLQDVGSYKTFFVSIQQDGLTLIYSGNDPSLNFSLQYRYKIPAFLPTVHPVKIGADLFIATEDGLFSLRSLLQSTGTELIELNLFEPIRPLWYILQNYVTGTQFVKKLNAIAIFFNKMLDQEQPFRIRPNSVLGDFDRFKLVNGYSVLLYDLTTKAISYLSFPFATQKTLTESTNSKNVSTCIYFIETPSDIFLAEHYYGDI